MKRPTSTASARRGTPTRSSRRKNKTTLEESSTPSDAKDVPSGGGIVPDLEKQVIEKLEHMVADALENHSTLFTKEEAAALKNVAARERAWQSIGMLAGIAKSILTYLGFFIAAWVAFKAGLLQWLAQELGR